MASSPSGIAVVHAAGSGAAGADTFGVSSRAGMLELSA